ncbi:MAG: hypothetical protein KKG99_17430 [Bacteroidetes bacterium]|nr:hypothetical protein [Bacteroidota bacterium]
MKKSDVKVFRHYEEYDTKKYGKVRLLKYKDETKNKRKVCKVGDDSTDYFFIPESELIAHERERKKHKIKRSPVEAQREYHKEMTDQGFKPKTYYLSESNIQKLEELKEKSGHKKWNDFMNELIDNL